jgi:DNA-binding MarR family transcriptional regulator
MYMESLAKETIASSNTKANGNTYTKLQDCSSQLIETIPVIMRRIRREMHRRTMPGLSLPQFRVLSFLEAHPRASLSDVAAHLGLTLPSTSKLVQNMVAKKVMIRRRSTDRRRVCLSLSQEGSAALAVARMATRQQLAESLSSLNQKELSAISDVLHILNTVFSGVSADVNIP